MKTCVEIIPNQEVSQEMREQMWQIYKAYYAYTKESFMARFVKNSHYAIYRMGKKLIGFTGMRINYSKIKGRKTFLAYFGQTVVKARYRGKSLLQMTAVKLWFKYAWEILTSRAYFWCDALTYKPYLVFSRNQENYYPNRFGKLPEEVEEVRNYLGETHYGENYCNKTGTVKKDTKVVIDPNTIVKAEDLKNPDIEFYVTANPNYIKGHGLITMAPITIKNFKPLVRRIIEKKIQPKIRSFIQSCSSPFQ